MSEQNVRVGSSRRNEINQPTHNEYREGNAKNEGIPSPTTHRAASKTRRSRKYP
jgi:hypothetical protein